MIILQLILIFLVAAALVSPVIIMADAWIKYEKAVRRNKR